jgi:hypothetical protein
MVHKKKIFSLFRNIIKENIEGGWGEYYFLYDNFIKWFIKRKYSPSFEIS